MTTFEKESGVKLISFDGGGIRGLSSLIILKGLMYQIQQRNHLDTMPLPYMYFDMMAGTSTGGLIALMLGRLRMSVDEAIEAYKEFSKSIFGEFKHFGEGKFKASNLEKAIQDVVEKKTGDRFSILQDSTAKGKVCMTFVCAHNSNAMGTRVAELFRTYDHPKHPSMNCTIWEAARATSAAPMFFKPMEINGKLFVDGGISLNNPTELMLQEARDIFPDRPFDCVISLGTGRMNPIALAPLNIFERAFMALSLIRVIKAMILDCERVHDTVTGIVKLLGIPDQYFRFSVDSGLQDIKLSDWEKLGLVDSLTSAYLRDEGVIKNLSKAALLVELGEVPELGHTSTVDLPPLYSGC